MNQVSPQVATARRRSWMIVFLIMTTLAAVVALAGAGLFKMWINQSKSVPYKMALEKVVSDARVIEALGEPIKEQGKPASNISEEGDQGTASITFYLEGSKGTTANVVLQARKIGGVWGLNSLDVMLPDDTKISIDTATGGESDAPTYSPTTSTPPEGSGMNFDIAPPPSLDIAPPTEMEFELPVPE